MAGYFEVMNKNSKWQSRKVVVVGAGAVGSTFAYALMQAAVADEIVIVDANAGQAEGQVLDLAHGLPFTGPVDIRAGTAADYADAQLIVITAGAKQRPGESRLNLLRRNSAIVEGIVRDCAANPHAVIMVVSNPVDVLTRVALEAAGWPRGRVIGSGTVLDSARFRYLLGRHCGVNVQSVHSYILGEHGDSEVAAWSMTHIAGVRMGDYCRACGKCGADAPEHRQRIAAEVRDSAYHIINYKGATWFAVGLAMVRIARAVLRNERSVLTVSTLLTGEYGLHDVCLSVPCIVGVDGVAEIVTAGLAPEEQTALEKSAAVLRQTYADLRSPQA